MRVIVQGALMAHRRASDPDGGVRENSPEEGGQLDSNLWTCPLRRADSSVSLEFYGAGALGRFPNGVFVGGGGGFCHSALSS